MGAVGAEKAVGRRLNGTGWVVYGSGLDVMGECQSQRE